VISLWLFVAICTLLSLGFSFLDPCLLEQSVFSVWFESNCLALVHCLSIGLALCFTCLIIALDFCACLRMANLITVLKLKCIAGWVFTITQEVVVANTLVHLILTCSFR